MIRKIYLFAESILSVIISGWLILSVSEIYRDGIARKAYDPLAWIYTREIIAEKFSYVMHLLVIFLILTSIGLIMKVNDVPETKINRDFMLSRTHKHDMKMQILILISALGFIIAGIFNGSASDVLYKAVNICTECVGLG